jgi:GDP-L-fucose synthase
MTEPLKLKGLRVLVAGASGFIGSHLAKRLSAEGARVRASHFSRPLRIEEDGLEVIQADLRDMDSCRNAVDGMDVVFMCAAVTSGAAAIRQTPLIHVTPNVVMNTQMMAAAYEAGVRRFVFISTGAVYPSVGARPVREDEVLDGDPYDAYFPAAWMKRYAEILCQTYAERIDPPMSTVVVRPSNIYGPLDKFDFATSHMTAALIRKVIERHRPIEVWGTGEDVRDLIYIDDFIEGLVRAAGVPDAHFVANICSGRGYSVRDILQTALAVDGCDDAEIRLQPDQPSTIPILLMDESRARNRLDFTATTTLEDGLRRTMAWYRETVPLV